MSQWQCENKLARRLFNFGVVNTTDDDCEQQMPSVALRLQQLIALAVRRRSAWLISSVVWRQVEQETVLTINICTYFVFETRISPESSVWEGSDCSSKINDANFLCVMPSEASILGCRGGGALAPPIIGMGCLTIIRAPIIFRVEPVFDNTYFTFFLNSKNAFFTFFWNDMSKKRRISEQSEYR